MSAHLDLQHTAQPDIFRFATRSGGGRVMLNRCIECRSIIWRTPERFIWQHSVPSRTSRLAVIQGGKA